MHFQRKHRFTCEQGMIFILLLWNRLVCAEVFFWSTTGFNVCFVSAKISIPKVNFVNTFCVQDYHYKNRSHSRECLIGRRALVIVTSKSSHRQTGSEAKNPYMGARIDLGGRQRSMVFFYMNQGIKAYWRAIQLSLWRPEPYRNGCNQ